MVIHWHRFPILTCPDAAAEAPACTLSAFQGALGREQCGEGTNFVPIPMLVAPTEVRATGAL